jgi:pantoate--beta-alanine ligase
MQVVFNKKELNASLASQERENRRLGLVPTMGALHPGHLSLVKKAIETNDLVVVSIFVNPTQFNNQEDLKKYPKTLEADLHLLRGIEHNLIVFVPSVSDMYHTKVSSREYSFSGLDKVMEGQYREGHFNGVATIVEELFTLIKPDSAYFGEKDYQQLLIVKKMVKQRHLPVDVIGCPIVREANGLAMSSRNELLSPSLKEKGAKIYETLQTAKRMFGTKSATKVSKMVEQTFKEHPDLQLEYFQIADANTLRPVRRKRENGKYRAFIAVYADGVRLIDNIALN